MDALKDRIRALRGASTQEVAAQRAGISQVMWSKLERGVTTESAKLPQIARAFAVTIDWLELGQGARPAAGTALVLGVAPAPGAPGLDGVGEVDADTDLYIHLRRLDVRASAGPGAVNPDGPEVIEYIPILRSFLRELGVTHPEHVDIIDITGQSMGETAPHGSIAIVDRTVRRYVGDGVYILLWHDAVVVKRLRAEFGSQRLAIQSDNPDKSIYPTEYLDREQLQGLTIIARMIYVLAGRRV